MTVRGIPVYLVYLFHQKPPAERHVLILQALHGFYKKPRFADSRSVTDAKSDFAGRTQDRIQVGCTANDCRVEKAVNMCSI